MGPGQRIGIGWMSNWLYAQQVPTGTWRSAMTLPRVLTLQVIEGAYSLRSSPVKALKALRGARTDLGAVSISRKQEVSGSFSPSRCELLLQTDLRDSHR